MCEPSDTLLEYNVLEGIHSWMRARRAHLHLHFSRAWRSITWIGSVLTIASDGLPGAMQGEIIMFLITVMLMMMGTGAILPSERWQGSFNVFCILAWSAMRARP